MALYNCNEVARHYPRFVLQGFDGVKTIGCMKSFGMPLNLWRPARITSTPLFKEFIMRRTVLFLALALTTSSSFAHGDGDSKDISKVNGSIHADSGQTYGDLDTVNGSIRIDAGSTVGNVETVNGAVSSEDKAVLASASTVNGAIKLGAQSRVEGNVETVNGGITVGKLSELKGNHLSTVNGKVLIYQSTIHGRVSTVNGDITVGSHTKIHGGILVDKPTGLSWGKPKIPRVLIGPNAVVKGDLVFKRDVELVVHSSAKIGKVTGATAIVYTDKIPDRKD